MSSDVVLTSALRTNLQSLQRTQSLIDQTQERLSTGLKVNSALDNPQSFFASRSLSNRASDLSALLDGLGQAIKTVETANQGLESLETLLSQAESLADEARTALGSGSSTAQITGNVAFDGGDELIAQSANIVATDEITLTFTDENGDVVNIDTGTADDTSNGPDGTADATAEFIINADETVDEFLTTMNGLRDTDGNKVVEASLTSDGYIKIEALSGGDFQIGFQTTGGAAADADLAEALGFGGSLGVGALADNDTTTGSASAGANAATTFDSATISVTKSSTIDSFALYQTDGTISKRSDTLISSRQSDLTTRIVVDADAANNGEETPVADVIVRVNNGDYVSIGSTDETIQEIVDGINDNTSLNEQIKASYSETTGKISIQALTSDVKSFSIGIGENDDDGNIDTSFNLGFGIETQTLTTTDDATAGDIAISTQNVAFGPGAGRVAQIESDFNTVRTQIDQLVEDTSYRGVNLLNGDDLTAFFNEDRTNSLTIAGADFTTGTEGLSISEAVFSTVDTVTAALNEVRDAKTSVRNFSSSLSTSLNVIQTRQDYTSKIINTLESGADALVVADANEEGAKLLALQTRQALGTTALSLASQSAQSVLRLF